MMNTLALAPHIEDITRALGNDTEPSEIEQQLQVYLDDYVVDLETAKRMIVKNHGGNPDKLTTRIITMVEEITPNLNTLNLLCRILSITEKSVTFRNSSEPQLIWYGLLGDPSGVMGFTAWEDFDLHRGDVVRVAGAYTRQWKYLMESKR